MAEKLPLETVKAYPVPGTDLKVDLAALAQHVASGEWTRAGSIADLKLGQTVRVDALGSWRLGVVVKLGRTKASVALTTWGAISEAERFGTNVRVQASSYQVTDIRVNATPALVDEVEAIEVAEVAEVEELPRRTRVTPEERDAAILAQRVMDENAEGLAKSLGATHVTVEDMDMVGSWPAVAEFKLPTDGLTNWGRRMVERAAQAEVYRGVAQVADQDEVAALHTQTAEEGPEERYGLEVLHNGQVAITDEWRGSWAGILSGRDALAVATRSIQKMNRQMIGLGGGRRPGRHDYTGHPIASARVCQAQVGVLGGGSTPCLLPPEDSTHRPAYAGKVRPGDVVTIHRGVWRFEVLRVELDAFASGERVDMAQVARVEREELEEESPDQWVNVDMLHVVETSAGDTGAILFAQRRLDQEVRELRPTA